MSGGPQLRRQHLIGSACAGVGAFCYGVTIAIGRSLAHGGLSVSSTLGTRFAIAGLCLMAALVVTRRPLLPQRGERLAALALGAIGYAVESTLFYLGLAHGTAAAVALLFYSYPAMVTLAESALRRTRPGLVVCSALALSVTGTVLIAGRGNRVDISAAGAGFTLGAAVAFSAYLIVGERLMRRTDSLTTGAWVALGAGASLLARSALSGGYHVRSGHRAQLIAYGAATAVAFTLMFAALRRLGSAQTAVVMTLEAVFAIMLAALFLGETIGLTQIIGGTAILAAAGLISWQGGRDRPPVPLATPPGL